MTEYRYDTRHLIGLHLLFGLRTKIYSAAFQCVNHGMYIINVCIDICDPPYEKGAYGNFQKTRLNTAFKQFSNMFQTVLKHV